MNTNSMRNHRNISSIKELERISNNCYIRKGNRGNDLDTQVLALKDIIYKTNSVIDESLHDHMNSVKKHFDKEFPKLPIQTYLQNSSKSLNDLGRESKLVKQKNYNSFVYSQNDLNEKRFSKDFSQTSKSLVQENRNINTNKLSVTGQMLSTENLSQINHRGDENQDNSKYLVSKEQYNNNICNSDNKVDTVRDKKLIKDIFLHNPETDKYEEKSKRILQYYFKNYWSQGDNSSQKVLYDIPNNLSVHRLKLERLKQLNNKNREKSSSSSDFKESHENLPFHKRVHFDNQTDSLHSESEKDYSNQYQPFHSDIRYTPYSPSTSKSKNNTYDYNSPKSILKNTNQLKNRFSNENQRASNSNIADPFKIERFQRLKQNENMVSPTVNAKFGTCKESQTENILESTPSRADDKKKNQDPNHLVNESLKITPMIPENQTETTKPKQITSYSTDPVRIQEVYELAINKEQQFHTKSVIESNKKFQMFGNPIQVCNFKNLRDDDYTKAWKIKL